MQLQSFDPSNGDLVGEVTLTAIEDVKPIVQQSHSAQKQWRQLNIDDRIAALAKVGNEIQRQSEELAILLSREMGKDLRRAQSEVLGCAHGIPFYAQQAKQAIADKKVSGSTLSYSPLGVAAVISPWNYPLAMANNLLIPALVAGNTVIFKPSEETPLIAQAYADILQRFLPENVVQIVHGSQDLGQAIVSANINLIAFTGSMAAGKDIMQRASGSLKRLIMELGGNDPMIVMADADIRAAAGFAVGSSFENAGQMCTSTERIYVDETVADEFESMVSEIAAQYRVGPWDQSMVDIGPIINAKQRSKIIQHIDDAIGKGAQVLLGGQTHPERYISPTVLSNVDSNMLMEQEETFGPVVSISRYSDINNAIEKANDSIYGLGAVVFGKQGVRQVAKQLEAGMVGINGSVGGGGDAPWVGAKQSGYGFHGSADGHRQFTQVKVIS